MALLAKHNRVVRPALTGPRSRLGTWAIEHGIPQQSATPRGRLAKDGPMDSRQATTVMVFDVPTLGRH